MKTLYLVRHAKSSWDDPSLADRERPLNKRGKRNAPQMADFIADKITCPDVFVSSPSRRTQDTAVHFLNAFGCHLNDLILEEDLYHGYEEDMENVIKNINNSKGSVMLFVHNPGITDYVNQLTGANIFNIPTCGVAAISFDATDWAEISQCPTDLLFYYYPKGLALPH